MQESAWAFVSGANNSHLGRCGQSLAPSHSPCDSGNQDKPGKDTGQPFPLERVWQLTAHLPILDRHFLTVRSEAYHFSLCLSLLTYK